MRSKKILPLVAILLVLCTSIPAGASPDQGQANAVTVKVIVRFARIRVLPAADAKIIKQIGYGTIFQVLGKSGEYYQVAALNAAPASAKQAWYIHQSEVEATGSQQLQSAQENRLVKFEPLRPVAGQPVLFSAFNFRTPNLLKWDMGDGTVLTSGSKSSQVQEARLAYAYTTAGTYEVKVYDNNGNMNLPPLTVQVSVDAYPRSLQVKPEKPLANHPLAITALNFSTPEKILWDLGDGNEIKPGDKSGIVKPSFQITHIYTAPGTYTVKAWDANGNKSLPPVSLSIQVAADPSLIKTEPAKAATVPDNTASVQNLPNVVAIKPDGKELVESIPTPAKAKKNSLIKIGPYAGFFQPRDAELKSIYGNGDVIYGGRLGVHIWQGFYFWFSASQFKVISKTTFSEDKTTLTLMPFSAFLRCSLSLGFFKPYAGIGFTYMSFKEESAIGNVTGNGSSTAYEGGFELKMNRHFYLDLGVRYDLIKVNPTGFEIDLGGLQAGVSLLVSF
jgi:outer membrane receptor protein involved in Fe transport